MKRYTVIGALLLGSALFIGCGSNNSKAIESTNTGNSKNDVLSMMAQAKVPGVSIAVIKDFKIVEVIAAGVIDQNSQQIVTEQTRFQAASISKMVTAVAVMKWATDTQTPLGTNVKDMLTSWRLPENGLTTENGVTIEGLLRHTAGINIHGFEGYNRNASIPTLVQVLEGRSSIVNSKPIEVTSKPNTQWRYSGGGYTILQQAIEDQTGMSFSNFMNWKIIDFLALSNSTFDLEANFDTTTVSSGHIGGNSPVTNQFHVYPEKAAAGYWTNATDLATFGIQFQLALKGKSQMLPANRAQEMLKTTLSPDYAMGFEVFGGGRFGHTGTNEGFQSVIVLNHSGFGVVILTNSDNGDEIFDPIFNYFTAKYNK